MTILLLPLHKLAAVNALFHIAHETHDSHDHVDEHEHEHDQDEDESSRPEFSHRHEHGEPVHSHGMEISGLFMIEGLPRPMASVPAATYNFQDPPPRAFIRMISDHNLSSVFRPPIA